MATAEDKALFELSRREEEQRLIRNRILDSQRHHKLGEQWKPEAWPPSDGIILEPSYRTDPSTLNPNDIDKVDFYLNCSLGNDVKAIGIAEIKEFAEPVLEFGLELATFGNHPSLVKWILERGTQIHSGMFEQALLSRNDFPNIRRWRALFEIAEASDLTELVAVLMAFGWRPSQFWDSPTSGRLCALFCPSCVVEQPQLTLKLLAAEAQLRETDENAHLWPDWEDVVTGVFDGAIDAWDLLYLDKIRSYGADLKQSLALFKMVNPPPFSGWRLLRPVNDRYTMVIYLLHVGININKIWESTQSNAHRSAMWRVGIRPPDADHTVLTLALAAEDWAMASFFCCKDANPYCLDKKAVKPQNKWVGFAAGNMFGLNDHQKAKETVDGLFGLHWEELGEEAFLALIGMNYLGED